VEDGGYLPKSPKFAIKKREIQVPILRNSNCPRGWDTQKSLGKPAEILRIRCCSQAGNTQKSPGKVPEIT